MKKKEEKKKKKKEEEKEEKKKEEKKKEKEEKKKEEEEEKKKKILLSYWPEDLQQYAQYTRNVSKILTQSIFRHVAVVATAVTCRKNPSRIA